MTVKDRDQLLKGLRAAVIRIVRHRVNNGLVSANLLMDYQYYRWCIWATGMIADARIQQYVDTLEDIIRECVGGERHWRQSVEDQ